MFSLDMWPDLVMSIKKVALAPVNIEYLNK